MIFSLATPAVDILVERTSIAFVQIGDDETCVGSVGADFDAGNDPLDTAPTRGPVVELLEAARFAVFRRRLEARFRAGLKIPDMRAQCRGRSDAKDVIEGVDTTPVENFGAAIVTVGAQQDLDRGQLARIARNKRRRKARISLPPGRLAGRSMAVMKRPSPSNTTIG